MVFPAWMKVHLPDGQQIMGMLLRMDGTARVLVYQSELDLETQLSFAEISHLFYMPHQQPDQQSDKNVSKIRSSVSFQIVLDGKLQLEATAHNHFEDELGAHFYGVKMVNDTNDVNHANASEAKLIQLFVPKESVAQWRIEPSERNSQDYQTNQNHSGEKQIVAAADGQKIIQLVDTIILEAIQSCASDIHLRPLADRVELHYRIDGVMCERHWLNPHHYPAMVSRIKILGNMDIAERRLPQDGAHHFVISSADTSSERKVDLRISTIPVVEGESVVIRVLDPTVGLRSLAEIGFSSVDEAKFRKLLEYRNGMVLVTGATGSGKSTTLYAAMHALKGKNLNIISIEDPVEYRIDEVRQIEVNNAMGNTFARNLRHILRHDPDVILIGEIRDRETAQIAMESAFTGHLVLSTLHTQDAAGAVTRLLEMGVESYMIKDTVRGVLAQRLVRKPCAACGDSDNAATELDQTCSVCAGSGYDGRTAVYELLEMTSEMQEQIRDGVSAATLRELAIQHGMVPIEKQIFELTQQGEIAQ